MPDPPVKLVFLVLEYAAEVPTSFVVMVRAERSKAC